MKAAEDITVRSMLFVPGNHPRRLAKAFDCGADAVIIDLEDAVPASDKAAARIAAAGTVAASRNVAAYVRVNSWAGHDWRADLAEIVRPGLAGVVLPKAETVEELIAVDSGIAALETERSMVAGSVELLPLIESARGVESLSAIAGACPRIGRLSFGVADYSLDLGLLPSPDEAELDSFVRDWPTPSAPALGSNENTRPESDARFASSPLSRLANTHSISPRFTSSTSYWCTAPTNTSPTSSAS